MGSIDRDSTSLPIPPTAVAPTAAKTPSVTSRKSSGSKDRAEAIAKQAKEVQSISPRAMFEVERAFEKLATRTANAFNPITKSQNKKLLGAVQKTRNCIRTVSQFVKERSKFDQALKEYDESIKALRIEMEQLPKNNGLRNALEQEINLQRNLRNSFDNAAAFSEAPRLIEELAHNTALIRKTVVEVKLFSATKASVPTSLHMPLTPGRVTNPLANKNLQNQVQNVALKVQNAKASTSVKIDSGKAAAAPAPSNAPPRPVPPFFNRKIIPPFLSQAAQAAKKAAKPERAKALQDDLQKQKAEREETARVAKEDRELALGYLSELKAKMVKYIRADLLLNLIDTRLAQTITRFARSEAAKKAIIEIDEAKLSKSDNLKEIVEKIELRFYQETLEIQSSEMQKLSKEYTKEISELKETSRKDAGSKASIGVRVTTFVSRYLAIFRLGAAKVTYAFKQAFASPLSLSYKAQVGQINPKVEDLKKKIEVATGTRKQILIAKAKIYDNRLALITNQSFYQQGLSRSSMISGSDPLNTRKKAQGFISRIDDSKKEEKAKEAEQKTKAQGEQKAKATEAKTKVSGEKTQVSRDAPPPDIKKSAATAATPHHLRRFSGA